MIKSVAGLGDRIVIGWPMRTSMTFEGLGKGRRMRMMEEDIEFLDAHVPLIDGISSEYSDSLIARFEDRQRSVSVSGVSPSYGTMRNMVPAVGGRFINDLDVSRRRRVVFVGNELADDLFGTQEAVGETVMIHGSPFLVIGVLVPKDQDSSYSGRDHSKMIVPQSTFRALTGQKYVDNFIYKAPRPDLNETLNEEVRTALELSVEVSSRRRPGDPGVGHQRDVRLHGRLHARVSDFPGHHGCAHPGCRRHRRLQHHERRGRGTDAGDRHQNGPRCARTRSSRPVHARDHGPDRHRWRHRARDLPLPSARSFPPTSKDSSGSRPCLPVSQFSPPSILGLVGLVAGYFPARSASRLDPVVAMKL